MFAGAAFTDQSDIAVDADVVDTMSSLGVIEGYLDGSFRPDDTVTRAEMAKMIYIIRTGRSDASAYNDDATTFTDIGDHWARGYIKYCNSMGIIAGHSATRFAPDATVTTQEAAKMLLVTLGYNADTAGLVGAGWGAKTNALADENGLLEDVVNGTTQGLPRQYAAQLIYNAIFANTVVLRDGEYTNMNLLGTGKNPTIGEKYMDLQSYNTKLLGYKDKVVQLASTNGQRFNDYTVDHSDLVGKQVKVLYKEAAVSTNKSTIYGIFLDDDYSYADTIVGNVKDLNTAKDEIKIDGTKTDVASDAKPVVKSWANYKSAQPVTVVYNDKGEVYDLQKDTNFEVAKISYVGTTKVTIGNDSLEIEDIELYDGFAKDDWTVKSHNDYTDKDAYAKADVVTGEVEVINGDDITIDGTVYTKAADAVSISGIDLGNTVEAVIVNGYIYNAEKVTGIASLDEIVYIHGAKVDNDYGKKTAMAQATFADGTSADIRVVEHPNYQDSNVNTDDSESKIINAIENNGTTKNDVLDGLFAYELDGEKYTLKEITVGDSKDFEGADKNVTTAGDDKIGSLRVNDDAVVFVKDGDGDVVVKTGKEVKAWSKNTAATGVAYGNKVSGYIYVDVAALEVSGDVPGAAYDAVYGYVVKELGETKEDNKKYTSFSVWTGSENETFKIESAKVGANVQKGAFVKIENDGINVVGVAGAISGFDAETVSFYNVTGEYNITDDTQIIYVDSDKDVVEGVGGGELSEATDHNIKDKYENNVVYVVDTADKNPADGTDLVALFVDINNEIVIVP